MFMMINLSVCAANIGSTQRANTDENNIHIKN